MNGFSVLESVFAWAMIAGGLAILIGVRWRPMKLWHSQRQRGGGLRSLFGGSSGNAGHGNHGARKPR